MQSWSSTKPICSPEMPSQLCVGLWKVRQRPQLRQSRFGSDLKPTTEYTGNLRLILCANSTSRIIGPIRSRCLLLRVGAPAEEEVCLCCITIVIILTRAMDRSALSCNLSPRKRASDYLTTLLLCSPTTAGVTCVAHFYHSKLCTRKTLPCRR